MSFRYPDGFISNSINTLTASNTAGYYLSQLYSWGRNNLGQLGQNNTTNYSSPVQALLPLNNWKTVVGSGWYNGSPIALYLSSHI